jgi:two-component system response regulator MprA
MPAPLILLVEDDQELRAVLRRSLEEEGFAVSGARTGAEAMERVSAQEPDALVIDVGLPDADGRDLCQALRARGVQSPVLFLTARDALVDRLAGFGAGGDDYLTKPFALAELAARLRAQLMRAGSDGTISAAGLILDPTTHEATGGGRSVRLTPTEFRLLGAPTGAERGAAAATRRARPGPTERSCNDNTIDVTCAPAPQAPSDFRRARDHDCVRRRLPPAMSPRREPARAATAIAVAAPG